MVAMTQKTAWAATLAPIGRPGITGHTIDPKCVITVHESALLLAPNGTPIGRVSGASIVDDHLVVTGILYPDQELPNALPTFDHGYNDRRTAGPVDSEDPRPGTVTFHTIEINMVRTGFEPAWPDDPEIAFVRNWCVHVVGPDDLIPMPDYATADRAATRFNHWWQHYRTQRNETDLPDTPAIVRPWPYDADHPNGHAEALAELRTDDPDGLLSTSPSSVIATSERRLPGGSLAASFAASVKAGRPITSTAGWCAPSEPIRDLCEIAEREFTPFRTEADVTEELLDIVRSVVRCHYQPGTGSMNMVDVADRIEDHVLDNGTHPDLGDNMVSPAMKKITDFALQARRDLKGI